MLPSAHTEDGWNAHLAFLPGGLAVTDDLNSVPNTLAA